MARVGGARMNRKKTTKEIGREVALLEEQLRLVEQRIDAFTPLVQAIVSEMDRLNTILLTYLDEQGRLQKIECDCGQTTYYPALKGMTEPTTCAFCSKLFADGEEE